jgi:hypothetical protein
MAAPTKIDVYAALVRKCGFDVVQEKETAKQLRIMGRIPVERWNFYVPVIHRILTASAKPVALWTCDISKQYLLRNDQVLYAWRLIFQADTLAAQYGDITKTILSAPSPSRVELQSQLLPGCKPGDVRGGFNAKGKGTGAAGSLPLAATRSR